MQKSLKMVFLDTEGSKKSITIPEVKSDINTIEIEAIVETIVKSDIFGDDIKGLDSAVEASIISRDVETITF